MKPTLLILAAGVGSRYGGLKQVDQMGPGGESILEFSAFDAIRAGFGKIVFVIRRDIEDEFRQRVGAKIEPHIDTRYAFQQPETGLEWLDTLPHREKPWGTGHAILAAKAHITEPFLVINADDFYGAESFGAIGAFLSERCTPDVYGMVAYRLANTLSENGSVSRGVCSADRDGFLTEVTERTKIERGGDGVIRYFDENGVSHALDNQTPVSMNFWGFHHSLLETIEALFRQFVLDHMDQPKAEFYIPTVVNHQIQTGAARVAVMTTESPWFGVTYTNDKQTVQAALRNLTDAGAYPSPLWSNH